MTFSKYCLDVFSVAYKTRAVDKKMAKLVKQNKGTTFFLSAMGHEIIGATFSKLMNKDDWFLPYYRDRAFALGLCPVEDIFAAFLARDIPHHSGGRMMPDHFSDKSKNIVCQSSCVGSQILQAVGVAKGIKLAKKDQVVYVSFGEGATSQGDFHEALNFSSIHKLPVLFVVQDNGFAISTPVSEQTAGGCISHIAKGYKGLSVEVVDGTDFENLSSVAKASIEDVRRGRGPILLVIKVPRLGPHTISDDPKRYKDEKLIKKEMKKDPLIHLENLIIEKFSSKEEIEDLKSKIDLEVEKAALNAEKIPFPKKESVEKNLFKEFEVEEKPPSLSKDIFMIEGINNALIEEMERDPKIVVFGQDVAKDKGGVFGATKGLTKRFGERCFNTPLAESTIVGIAIGLSLYGYRPVAEIQFSDYCWTGINQIVNELSSMYYRSNGEWNCQVVIRMTCGGYIQGGPYHSQSLEAIFAHIPGLKIALPSNALDAKRLLKTSIRDPNPVIFLEHKALYRLETEKESSKDDLLPFKANIVKEGDKLTVVCYSYMAFIAKEVAKDIDMEIIDIRTINPLDIDIILTSLKKTGRLMIIHEACKKMGFGAEIASQVMEKGFDYLDAPIIRVAAKNLPIAYCRDLEDEILPQKKDIEKAAKELISF